MKLYMLNRQHGRMILESVENDPLLWPTVEKNGVTRLKKYPELSPTEAIQADSNVKATNIILQGLPSEVFTICVINKWAYCPRVAAEALHVCNILIVTRPLTHIPLRAILGVLQIGIKSQGYREPDTIMSDSKDSTVTDTAVSSPYEGRSGDVSQGVDGPPVMPEDPYAYVVTVFQALPSPNYVPGPEEPEQAPPSPVYIPYVPEPEYLEYIPPEDEVFPAEEQPLPAAASPTTNSPRYILESDSDKDSEDDDDEDPEEDPADYPADHDDEEEEDPSGDDADEENEKQDEDDDDEEEEHPASADSIPPPPALKIESKHPCTFWVPLKKGMHRNNKRGLAHEVAIMWKLV
nr:hypothetical protein [Tanacetum cinerariifolium]